MTLQRFFSQNVTCRYYSGKTFGTHSFTSLSQKSLFELAWTVWKSILIHCYSPIEDLNLGFLLQNKNHVGSYQLAKLHVESKNFPTLVIFSLSFPLKIMIIQSHQIRFYKNVVDVLLWSGVGSIFSSAQYKEKEPYTVMKTWLWSLLR